MSQVASTPFVMKDLKSSLPTGEYPPHPEQEGEPCRLFDSLPDGFYSGSARHRDGTLIPVWFQVSPHRVSTCLYKPGAAHVHTTSAGSWL